MNCTHMKAADGRIVERCYQPATHKMISPVGQPVPGGLVCIEHGKLAIDEYAQKLGQHWYLRSIDEHGRLTNEIVEPDFEPTWPEHYEQTIRCKGWFGVHTNERTLQDAGPNAPISDGLCAECDAEAHNQTWKVQNDVG